MVRHSPSVLAYEVKRRMLEIPHDRLFNDPKNKRLLEKWSAAKFGVGFRRHVDGAALIEISDEDEQREFDFHLLSRGQELPFQIVEVLDPDRRRGLEYKQPPGVRPAPDFARPASESADYSLERIASELQKKIQKRYSGSSELHVLVYLNMLAPQQRWSNLRQGLCKYTHQFASVWAITDRFISCIYGGSFWPREAVWKSIRG